MMANPTRSSSAPINAASHENADVAGSMNHNKQDYNSYYPYATSMTEASMFHLFFSNLCGCKNGCILCIISLLYKIRWMLSYPLRTRIVPHWVPYKSPTQQSNSSCCIPQQVHRIYNTFLSSVIQLTVGEVLLCAPIAYWLIEGYYAAFVSSTATSIPVTGNLSSYVILLTYLSANKSNSFFAFLFGIPFERMISFHYLCSVCAVALSMFHIYISYEQRGRSTSTPLISYLKQDETNISGAIAAASMIALVSLSIHSKVLRYYAFQLWLTSHIIFAIAVLVALFLHGVYIGVFVAMWWLFDLMVRYGIMTMCQYRVPTEHVQLRRIAHPQNDPTNHTHEPAVEISFLKPIGFDYSPGQFVQIAIPAISIFEFHPVSISSAPHEEYVTMHFRDRGDWTHKLVQLTDTKTSTAIWMEGPYGSLSVDIHDTHRYQMVLLLCAGIGVTPIQSIGKSILHAHQHQNRPLKYMNMVWVARDMHIVHDVPPLGIGCAGDASNDNSNVQIDIFCTRTNGIGNIEPVEQSLSDPEVGQQSSNKSSQSGKNGNVYNVHHGQRPDVDVIFEQMQQRAHEMGEYNIAVFACGPSSFMNDVHVACRTYSHSSIGCPGSAGGVYFDLHTEHFEF